MFESNFPMHESPYPCSNDWNGFKRLITQRKGSFGVTVG